MKPGPLISPLCQCTYSKETKVEIFVGIFEIVNVGPFGESIAVSSVFENNTKLERVNA